MVTRRDFLKTMTMASAGLAAGAGEILNAQTLSSSKNKNEKVKIAYVGIGNRGQQIIEDFARTGMVEVVALCDVDMGAKHTQKVIGMYPNPCLSEVAVLRGVYKCLYPIYANAVRYSCVQ